MAIIQVTAEVEKGLKALAEEYGKPFEAAQKLFLGVAQEEFLQQVPDDGTRAVYALDVLRSRLMQTEGRLDSGVVFEGQVVYASPVRTLSMADEKGVPQQREVRNAVAVLRREGVDQWNVGRISAWGPHGKVLDQILGQPVRIRLYGRTTGAPLSLSLTRRDDPRPNPVEFAPKSDLQVPKIADVLSAIPNKVTPGTFNERCKGLETKRKPDGSMTTVAAVMEGKVRGAVVTSGSKGKPFGIYHLADIEESGAEPLRIMVNPSQIQHGPGSRILMVGQLNHTAQYGWGFMCDLVVATFSAPLLPQATGAQGPPSGAGGNGSGVPSVRKDTDILKGWNLG